jgi:hypothetical protein
MVSNRTGLRRSIPALTQLHAGLALCVVTIVIGPIVDLTPARAQAAVVCSTDISWNEPPAALPDDVCDTTSTTDATASFFSLSWQLFKYLVWPASNERGKPDVTRKITDKAGPRTFETFKADWETFLPNAEKPADWNEYPRTALPCSDRPAMQRGDLVLASFTKFGNLNEVSGPQLGNLLIAQNNTYVRYLAAYNETVFRKISDKELYNSDVVGQIQPAPVGTAILPLANQDNGALTVKSAWIELPEQGPSPIDPSRFYRRQAWIQSPDNKEGQNCRRAWVGLVGLHIVYKTKSRPQWIWATFEHVDNVPTSDPQAGRRFTFNDGDGNHHMTAGPDPDYRIPRPTGSSGPGNPPRPFQVERLQRIDRHAIAANDAQQTALRNLDSVWQYYGLVMAQWPSILGLPLQVQSAGPEPPCGMRGSMAVTNTTMETFLQTQSTCDFALTCMGCHATARNTDFVFSIAINSQKPAGKTSVPIARQEAIKQLGVLQKALDQ